MVYCTDDIHGGKYEIVRLCNQMNLTSDDIVVILGDVRANYYENERNTAIKLGKYL